MRTLLLTFTAIFISIVTMISCTKEKVESTVSKTTPSDEQLVSQVHWFMDAAKDVKEGKYLKSGEKMIIDSAIYFISATLNYKYCHHMEHSGNYKQDTIIIKIPVLSAEGKTFVVDALIGYNASILGIRDKYAKIFDANKKLTGCMVKSLGVTDSGDTIQIQIISQFRYEFAQQSPNSYTTQFPFTNEENYWWLRDSQNCFSGSPDEGGAPNVIESTLTFGLCPAPPPNCRIWFPAYDEIAFNYLDYEVDIVKDNFCDYKIFYASGTTAQVMSDQVQCLGVDPAHPGQHEMSFYCNGLLEIIQNFQANLPPTSRACKELIVMSPPPSSIYGNMIEIKHVPHFFYGKKLIDCFTIGYPIPISQD